MYVGGPNDINCILKYDILLNSILLETPLCEIGSIDDLYYLPFLTLSGDGVFNFPHYLGSLVYPITLPQPLPLGIGVDVTMYTTAYVSYKLIIIHYLR